MKPPTPFKNTSPEPVKDPEMQTILDAMRARKDERSPIASTPPPVMRKRMTEDFRFWNEGGPGIKEVRELDVPGPHGDIGIRWYDPCPGETDRPALVYLHGGGWIVGSPLTEDRSIRELVDRSKIPVCSIDYRLAPENPFPSQLEECVAVIQWLRSQATELGIDPGRFGLGGASAGANLALCTLLKLRDEAQMDGVKACLLFYGVFARRFDTESHRKYGDGAFGLSSADMAHFWRLYTNGELSPSSAGVMEPLAASLHDLPQVRLIAAGLDPLLDDSQDLHQRLLEAGVPSNLSVYHGVIHGFTVMLRQLSAGRRAMHEAADFLTETLLARE